MPNPSELARLDAEARITRHHDAPMCGGNRLPKLSLFEIAGAIRAAHDRIRNADRQTHGEREQQLRGVRRTAAHIADLLPDSDKSAFLTACGYGA